MRTGATRERVQKQHARVCSFHPSQLKLVLQLSTTRIILALHRATPAFLQRRGHPEASGNGEAILGRGFHSPHPHLKDTPRRLSRDPTGEGKRLPQRGAASKTSATKRNAAVADGGRRAGGRRGSSEAERKARAARPADSSWADVGALAGAKCLPVLAHTRPCEVAPAARRSGAPLRISARASCG